MGRRNVLITAAVLAAGGLAVFAFASTAAGDTNESEAELGTAVVANVGGTSVATPEPVEPTAGPSAVPSSTPTPTTTKPKDDGAKEVTVPKPKKVSDDDDDDLDDDGEDGDDDADDDDDDDGDDD